MSIGPRKQEATFSREVRAALLKLKVMTFKVNERVRRGIPDIYVAGGNWIESKVIAHALTIKNYPLKYFTGMQRITMDTLVKKGDTCFVAILWYGEYDKSLLFMPWYVFRRIKIWDARTVSHFSVPYIGPASMDMTPFFWADGRWNGVKWREEVFEKWTHKDNIRVYDINYVPEELNDALESAEDAENDVA